MSNRSWANMRACNWREHIYKFKRFKRSHCIGQATQFLSIIVNKQKENNIILLLCLCTLGSNIIYSDHPKQELRRCHVTSIMLACQYNLQQMAA